MTSPRRRTLAPSAIIVPPHGSPAFAEDDDLRRHFHLCHPTLAIPTSPLSSPRRQRSRALAPSAIIVPPHGSPAFAEDDDGGWNAGAKKVIISAQAEIPYTHNKKREDPKIPPTKVFMLFRLLKQPDHIAAVIIRLAGHRHPDLLQNLQAGQFGHLG